ncbi:MAG: hypothetical protein ABI036_20310, partial [Fibrobacteria bacterium]
MLRAFLAVAFILTLAISGFSQPNSEKVSQPAGITPPPPASAKLVKDSLAAVEAAKAAKAKRKSKAKAAAEAKVQAKAQTNEIAADSGKTPNPPSIDTSTVKAAAKDSAKAVAPPASAAGADSSHDSASAAPAALAPKAADTVSVPVIESM